MDAGGLIPVDHRAPAGETGAQVAIPAIALAQAVPDDLSALDPTLRLITA